jgi:uncharacterized membrane protein
MIHAETMHHGDRAATDRHVNPDERLAIDDTVADRVTRQIGSWRFILVYFALLTVWMGVNTVAWIRHWDPYPFIFLNLILSFQGAFAAPIILMSQNRQEERDRLAEQYDHAINLRAEREVAALQSLIAELERAMLAEFTVLRAEHTAMRERLDAILTMLAGNGVEESR